MKIHVGFFAPGVALIAATLFDGCISGTDDAGADSSPKPTATAITEGSYPIVDTCQVQCYDTADEIGCPAQGDSFYGQDAQFSDKQPSYTVSADGMTVYDEVTGLTRQGSPENLGLSYEEA